jgi:hypothetical protein
MGETFREDRRRSREAAAFENLYAYARNTGTPDPKRTAERAAREIHREPTSSRSRPANGAAPSAADLEEQTRDELYARARDLDIEGRSQMTKAELVEALRGNG